MAYRQIRGVDAAVDKLDRRSNGRASHPKTGPPVYHPCL
jgi:hypothetical protein